MLDARVRSGLVEQDRLDVGAHEAAVHDERQHVMAGGAPAADDDGVAAGGRREDELELAHLVAPVQRGRDVVALHPQSCAVDVDGDDRGREAVG